MKLLFTEKRAGRRNMGGGEGSGRKEGRGLEENIAEGKHVTLRRIYANCPSEKKGKKYTPTPNFKLDEN